MKVFGDWEIKESIGKGSFGEVYRIEKEDFGHVYQAALKVIEIPQHAAEFDTMRREGMTQENVTEYFYSMVENVEEEIMLMYKLKGDSHIVSYEDHAVTEKKDSFGWTIKIKMELLTPLSDYIAENDITQEDIVHLGMDMCRALELCRKQNIIHRDLKPENIFISDKGTFKLGDFGIARELEKTSAGLSMKGTRGYMAPEVYKGEKYNATVDIYSLGIVLYRYLNGGRMPFMPPIPEKIKYSDTTKAFERRYSGEEPLPKPTFAEKELSEIVRKACAYNSGDRYPSAADMRLALERLWGRWTDEEKNRIVLVAEDKEEEPSEPKPRLIPEPSLTTGSGENGTMCIVPKPDPVDRTEKHDSEQESEDKKPKEKIFIEPERKKKDTVKKPFQKKIWLIGTCALVFIVLLSVGIISFAGMHDGDDSKSVNAVSQETFAAKPTAAALPTKTPSPVVTKQPTPSKGPEKVAVPNFKGLSVDRARKKAKSIGLRLKTKSVYSSHAAKGKIVGQSQKAGKKVEKKTAVTITVSKGKHPVRPTLTPTQTPRPTQKPTPKPTQRPKKTAAPKGSGKADDKDKTFR